MEVCRDSTAVNNQALSTAIIGSAELGWNKYTLVIANQKVIQLRCCSHVLRPIYQPSSGRKY